MARSHKVAGRSVPRVAPGDVAGKDYTDVVVQEARARLPKLNDLAIAVSISLTRLAGSHVSESEARVHRPRGWTWGSFRVLYMIWTFEEVEARHLARLAGVSRQATSTVLGTLENHGLITRERTSTTDRRLVTVRLTPAGTKAIEEAFLEQNRLEVDWFGVLSTEEQEALKGLLDRVTARIAESRRET